MNAQNKRNRKNLEEIRLCIPLHVSTLQGNLKGEQLVLMDSTK
jgi:hypothetical protein